MATIGNRPSLPLPLQNADEFAVSRSGNTFRANFGDIVAQSTATASFVNKNHPTIQANGNSDVVFLAITKSGYTAIGIIDYYISAGGICAVSWVHISGENGIIRVTNPSSIAFTIGDVGITVLYKKNS